MHITSPNQSFTTEIVGVYSNKIYGTNVIVFTFYLLDHFQSAAHQKQRACVLKN